MLGSKSDKSMLEKAPATVTLPPSRSPKQFNTPRSLLWSLSGGSSCVEQSRDLKPTLVVQWHAKPLEQSTIGIFELQLWFLEHIQRVKLGNFSAGFSNVLANKFFLFDFSPLVDHLVFPYFLATPKRPPQLSSYMNKKSKSKVHN